MIRKECNFQSYKLFIFSCLENIALVRSYPIQQPQSAGCSEFGLFTL